MKKTGAWLTRYALEQLPITHTFGVPGMQNVEIYDELGHSEKITPILVMIDRMRFAHLVELLSSNFVNGLALVAILSWKRNKPQ